ncbi:MAG: allose kinase [Lachnospiraceae bacterium]|nr:allose kinase [Lachnospiraceae bacterium]
MSDKKYMLGIDIGGTNIRAGLVGEDYNLSDFIIESSTQIMDAEHAADKLLLFVKRYLDDQGKGKNIAGISLGFPSTIDRDRKVVLSTPNIAGLDNVPVVDTIEAQVGIPTYIDTDVDMLLRHDMFKGSIPDEGITAAFYLGTGLGNAIAINGELLIGKNGAAAELGHIPSRDVQGKCGCGNTSCVELFASGKHLREVCDTELGGAFIGNVFKEHSEDPAIRKFIHDLAIPVAAEINILDPDYIIIGGGVVQMPGFPKEQLETAIHEYARKPYPEQNLDFVYSVPGQENGVIGAGIHGFKQAKKRA